MKAIRYMILTVLAALSQANLGGTIRSISEMKIESSPDKGTKVTVTLPTPHSGE